MTTTSVVVAAAVVVVVVATLGAGAERGGDRGSLVQRQERQRVVLPAADAREQQLRVGEVSACVRERGETLSPLGLTTGIWDYSNSLSTQWHCREISTDNKISL